MCVCVGEGGGGESCGFAELSFPGKNGRSIPHRAVQLCIHASECLHSRTKLPTMTQAGREFYSDAFVCAGWAVY